jgi:hypothetical protein
MKCKRLLLLSFLISACTTPKFALDTHKVSFNELLDHVENEQKKIHSLNASCRISVDSEEFSGNFFAQVYYIKDDSLLISVTGPFGIQAGTLFIGKERFIFYNQLSNKFYNGSVKEFENQNFFQFPLQLKELINIFAAKEKLPLLKIDRYETENGSYVIQGHNTNEYYNITIDNVVGHIKNLEVKQDDRVIYRREYSSFFKSDNIFFPKKVSMIRPIDKQAVSIYYTNLTLNEEIQPENFIIKIADHAEQIYLSH